MAIKPNKLKKVAIILVDYNSTLDTIECIRSLNASTYPICRIILIDNSDKQDDALYSLVCNQAHIDYIPSGGNIGFAGANNIGIKRSIEYNVDYILLLNNDTVVKEDFLEKLISATLRENASISTGKIYYHLQPNVIWSAGGWINWQRGMGCAFANDQLDNGQFENLPAPSFITGCMMLIKREVFEQIGLLDEQYFMYCEDVDFSIKAKRADLKMSYVPGSIIWHKVGACHIEDSPFLFYYFLRNSLLITIRHAHWRQKISYFSYAPFFFLAKLLVSIGKGKRNLQAFLLAILDGFRGKSGKKTYHFLQLPPRQDRDSIAK